MLGCYQISWFRFSVPTGFQGTGVETESLVNDRAVRDDLNICQKTITEHVEI